MASPENWRNFWRQAVSHLSIITYDDNQKTKGYCWPTPNGTVRTTLAACPGDPRVHLPALRWAIALHPFSLQEDVQGLAEYCSMIRTSACLHFQLVQVAVEPFAPGAGVT
jgi:hypothetical protein